MIPRIVHQLWLAPGGRTEDQEPPADVRKNMATWRKHHPELDHCLWTEGLFRTVFLAFEDLHIISVLDILRLPTMKSNLIRLCLLIRFGGYWSDLKNVVDCRFIHEIEQNELVLTEHQPMPEVKPDGYLTNSFIGARPGHPFLEETLATAFQRIKEREERSLSHVTGLVLLNYMAQKANSSGTMPQHRLLTRDEAWHIFMHRVSASYQAGGQHWSVVQKKGSLYL